jgi:hypothetical protein
MLQARLIELVETHADALTKDVLADLATNVRTSSFHLVPRDELEARVFATYHNLGSWIGEPRDDAVRADYGGRLLRPRDVPPRTGVRGGGTSPGESRVGLAPAGGLEALLETGPAAPARGADPAGGA